MEGGEPEQEQQPPAGRAACPQQGPGEGAEGAALPERPEPEEPDRHRHPRAALTAPGVPRAAPPRPPRSAALRPLAGRGCAGAQRARGACAFVYLA